MIHDRAANQIEVGRIFRKGQLSQLQPPKGGGLKQWHPEGEGFSPTPRKGQ
jgi:hypothetical protein